MRSGSQHVGARTGGIDRKEKAPAAGPGQRRVGDTPKKRLSPTTTDGISPMASSTMAGSILDFVPICSLFVHTNSRLNGNGVQILDVLREIIAERAKAINVSPAQWSYFQSGAREIQPQHAIRLCDLANVSLDYIY